MGPVEEWLAGMVGDLASAGNQANPTPALPHGGRGQFGEGWGGGWRVAVVGIDGCIRSAFLRGKAPSPVGEGRGGGSRQLKNRNFDLSTISLIPSPTLSLTSRANVCRATRKLSQSRCGRWRALRGRGIFFCRCAVGLLPPPRPPPRGEGSVWWGRAVRRFTYI